MNSPSLANDAECIRFLKELVSWDGVASSRDIGPIIRRAQDRARQSCRRHGFVTYEGGYWRLTDKGRELLPERERDDQDSEVTF